MVWYYMYFKRSFVARRDGKFMGHPHLNRPDVYPMTYAIAEAYIQAKFNFVREIEVLCTLRGNKRMTTRLRVQQWIADYTKEKGLKNAITSQINGATRTTVSKSYFSQMYVQSTPAVMVIVMAMVMVMMMVISLYFPLTAL